MQFPFPERKPIIGFELHIACAGLWVRVVLGGSRAVGEGGKKGHILWQVKKNGSCLKLLGGLACLKLSQGRWSECR